MNAPSRSADKVVIRLPDGLRAQLKELAQARYRTLNGQIVMYIESGLAAEKAASGQN